MCSSMKMVITTTSATGTTEARRPRMKRTTTAPAFPDLRQFFFSKFQ